MQRSTVVGGVILILLGALLLAGQILPHLFIWFSWPFFIIGGGALFIIAAAISGTGGLAIPGCIIGGIGGILFYQNLTGNWESWAYMWTLIPGFVGLGIALAGLLTPGCRRADNSGWFLMGISLVGFIVFGSAFGMNWMAAKFWPVILIVIGVIVLINSLFHPKR